MAISWDGWLDWAERVPGDPRKQNGGWNPVEGIVAHSAEGYEAYLRAYNTNQVYYADRRASWTFSNLFNGHLLQHFSIFAQVWASSAGFPNNHYVPIEHEGTERAPITRPQTVTTARIIAELSAYGGWEPLRLETLWEHTECRRWGAPPTACPSDRIPWDEVMALLRPWPEPEPPKAVRRRDMEIVGLEGPAADAYLLYQNKSYLIPDDGIYQDLHAIVYGPSPREISQRTWDWLHSVCGFVRMA